MRKFSSRLDCRFFIPPTILFSVSFDLASQFGGLPISLEVVLTMLFSLITVHQVLSFIKELKGRTELSS